MIRHSDLLGRAGAFLGVWLAAITLSSAEAGDPSPNDDLEIIFHGSEADPVVMSREALLAMEASVTDEVLFPYVNEIREATIVPLGAVLAAAGREEPAAVVAESYDGYYSVFKPGFIETYEPFLVLTIDGLEPGDLQLEGSPNLGPYFITFAAQPEKGSDELFDPDNKRPFGVDRLTVGAYDAMLAPLYAGALADLAGEAAKGRKLFVNNCMSCHAWSPEGPGGTFSNRTVPILKIHASYNPQYFKDYVYEPTKFLPDVMMPAHPHYDDAKVEAIIAFLKSVPDPQ